MAGKGKSGDQTIGYRKPPPEHQFKKGAPSPNPKGRPKKPRKAPISTGADFGAMRMNTMLMEEAYRLVPARDGDKTVQIPMMQAIWRTMAVKAANGDHHAQKQILDRLGVIEKEQYQLLVAYNDQLMRHKAGWTELINEARAAGHPEPQIFPHPEDIIFDYNTGKVDVYGPKTKEQKQRLDKFISNRDDCQEEVLVIKDEWEKASGTKEQADWLAHWHDAQKLFDLINDNLPPRHRRQLRGRSLSKGASTPGSQARVRFPENALIIPEFGAPPDQVQTTSETDKGSTRRRRPPR